MKKQKLWMAFTLVSVSLCTLFALTACGHLHDWEDPIFTESTCTESGGVEIRCKTCGYTTTELDPPLGHDMVDGVCSRCGFGVSSGLEYEYNGAGFIVKGIGDCTDKEIIIPATYLDVPVIAIADAAFAANKNITSVKIPESVVTIGKSAFEYCEKLSKITLPDGVTSIGEEAFANTAYFKDDSNWNNDVLYIGNHLIKARETISGAYTVREECLTIVSGAFRNCVNLAGITIGDDVTTIGDYAFYNAFYTANVSFYTSFEDLSGVQIGRGVKSIGEYAFAFCGLTKIEIPSTVTLLGESAFYRCLDLVSAKIDVSHISDMAFFGCNKLSDLTISDGVVSIGGNAFGSCDALTALDLPDSVTSIGETAFQACTKLSSIKFPACVDIGRAAFAYCKSLTSISMDEGTIGGSAFSNCSYLTDVTLNEVTKVGAGAFKSCQRLSSVELGSGLQEIGVGAFDDCLGLTSIEIPLGTERILERAFSGCKNLSNISLEMGLTVIGKNAFQYCESLAVVEIPDSILSIGEYAFFACSALESITLGQQLKTIGAHAFQKCGSLTSIVIPDSVTEIGTEAFNGCENLSEITLGKGVTLLGRSIFIGTAIKEINYRGTKERWDNIAKERWNDFTIDNVTPTYILHCIDGDFEIS